MKSNEYGIFEKGSGEMTERKTILETDRLVLRRFCEEDLLDLYEYLSDETVVRFEPCQAMDLNETKETLNGRISSDEMVAAALKSEGKLIGNICILRSWRRAWPTSAAPTPVRGCI